MRRVYGKRGQFCQRTHKSRIFIEIWLPKLFGNVNGVKPLSVFRSPPGSCGIRFGRVPRNQSTCGFSRNRQASMARPQIQVGCWPALRQDRRRYWFNIGSNRQLNVDSPEPAPAVRPQYRLLPGGSRIERPLFAFPFDRRTGRTACSQPPRRIRGGRPETPSFLGGDLRRESQAARSRLIAQTVRP
jgi:hypothetical protein